MPHTQDAALLRQLREDPQTGLTALLDTYGSLIRTLVGRVLRDAPQDAEEVTADVLVAAWRHAEELLCQQGSLKAWLCVTARNAAIDRWRTLCRSKTIPWDEEFAGDWLMDPRTGVISWRLDYYAATEEQLNAVTGWRLYYEGDAELDTAHAVTLPLEPLP